MILAVISIIASATSIFSLVPQIYRTYRLKSASDLSMLMLLNFFVCSICWVIYGGLTDMRMVWITNVVMTIFSIILIIFKLKYSSKPSPCNT